MTASSSSSQWQLTQQALRTDRNQHVSAQQPSASSGMMDKRASFPMLLYVSFAIVAASAALSSSRLISLMRGIRHAGSSGLLAVGGGIARANNPILGALVIGIVGLVLSIIVSLRSSKNTFSPPGLLLVASSLALAPVLILWVAESLLLTALPSSRDGNVANAELVETLLFMILGGGLLLAVLFLLGATLRLRFSVGRRRSSVAAMSVAVVAFTVTAFAFQQRNAWIHGLYTQLW